MEAAQIYAAPRDVAAAPVVSAQEVDSNRRSSPPCCCPQRQNSVAHSWPKRRFHDWLNRAEAA